LLLWNALPIICPRFPGAARESWLKGKPRPPEIDAQLFQIQGINGPLIDLRDYTTGWLGIYRELWLSENLSSWLPNVVQLCDRNGDMWTQFDQIMWDHREGRPLTPGESLGLFPTVSN
jgi:hypothetical protein